MARSRGQIRKRGPNKYLVRIYLGRIDGKRKYKSKVVNGSEEDAEKHLTKMLRRKDRGVTVAPETSRLSTFMDEWLDMKKGKVAEATLRNYRQVTEAYIKPGLGYMKLEELSARAVQAWVNDIFQDLAASTVSLVHATLRQALNQAVVWEMIPSNPADGTVVQLPKKKDSRDYRIFSQEEREEFLKATRGDRYYALWHLLFATGLRPQEALALKWSDFQDGWMQVQRVVALSDDEDQKYEVTSDMKTKRSNRRLRIPSYLQRILGEHRKKQARYILEAGDSYERNDFVFDRWQGRGLHAHPSTVRRDFNAGLEAAGLPSEIRLYDIRHTHISHLIMSGVDLKLASKRAGHSSIQQTADTYAHLTDEAEEFMADKVEQMYGRAAR